MIFQRHNSPATNIVILTGQYVVDQAWVNGKNADIANDKPVPAACDY